MRFSIYIPVWSDYYENLCWCDYFIPRFTFQYGQIITLFRLVFLSYDVQIYIPVWSDYYMMR